MKQFFKDFGKFISKGNVFELAVGVVVGTAFNAIVQSLVKDIIMPLFSAIVRTDIKSLSVTLVPAVVDETGKIVKEAVLLNYGNFIQNVINFLIISLSIFVAMRTFMKLKERALKLEIIAKEKLLNKKADEKVDDEEKTL